MNPKSKMTAASEALKRLQLRTGAIPPAAKMLAAREALARRLGEEQLVACKASGDRMIIGCLDVYMALLLGIDGYRRTKSAWVKKKRPTDFLPYRRVTVLKSTRNNSQILIYSERNSSKLEPYRILFIPDDTLGLEPKVVRSVLECIEAPPRFALLEIALDFPSGSGDPDWVI